MSSLESPWVGSPPEPARGAAWRAPVLTGALVVGGTIYTAALDPNTSHAFPLCPLKLLTGLDCPFCGCLRATHALARGHLVEAADHNLLFVLAVPYLVVWWAAWLLRSTGRPAPDLSLSKPAQVAVLVVLVLFTIARNLPVAGLHWLNSGVG
jgi:hypothetical protein